MYKILSMLFNIFDLISKEIQQFTYTDDPILFKITNVTMNYFS
jgi:hypothetical protein